MEPHGGQREAGPYELDSHALPYFRMAMTISLPI